MSAVILADFMTGSKPRKGRPSPRARWYIYGGLTADGAIRSGARGGAPTLLVQRANQRLRSADVAGAGDFSVFFGLLFGREDCFSSPRFDGFRVLRMTPLAAGVALPPLASDAIFKSPSFYASS
jgi:hypothetical protein